MSRPDDSTLPPSNLRRVRAEAERALREGGVFGTIPTPTNRILAAARVEQVRDDVLGPGVLQRLRAAAGSASGALRRAVSKVMGVFQASTGLIFLDQSLAAVKKRFVALHESGHGFLPWQRSAYALVEDCAESLDPEVADLFDREANVFAAEVLFQLDAFRDRAADMEFGIFTPVRLARDFDASIYSSVRQYVSKNSRACAVLVLDMPVPHDGDGFRATLRRPIHSPVFAERFGKFSWKAYYTPDDELGRLIPLGSARASGKRTLVLADLNGLRHDCIAEAFTQRHQVFILVHPVATLTATRVILPSGTDLKRIG